MPWEETENEIRQRIKNPDLFEPGSFRSKSLSGIKGVRLILGKLKDGDGSMTTQAVRFSKDNWTMSEAKAWFAEHNFDSEEWLQEIGKVDVVIINKSVISNDSWGNVNKDAIRGKLTKALQDGEAGAQAAIREMYAVIESPDLREAPSSNWWGPHHEMRGNALVLNREGLGAAAAALAGARADPSLTPQEKQKAATHLIRHYDQFDLEVPDSLKEIRSDNTDTHSVIRYDQSRVGQFEITDQGYLKADGRLTRTGVFTYHKPDGTEFKELRLPEDVFDPESMSSFGSVVITDDHPVMDGIPLMLNAANTKDYAVGYTMPEVRRDGDFLEGTLLITDQKTIDKVKAGKNKLSNGYRCDLEMSPGVWNGESYHAIQRRIRGNHVAIVDSPRAGEEARIRIDSNDNTGNIAFSVSDINQESHNINKKENYTMAKFKVDGVDLELPDGSVSLVQSAIEKRDAEIAKLKKDVEAGQKELEKEKGRADAAEAEAKKAKEEKVDEDKLNQMINDRAEKKVALLAVAKQACPDGKFDGLADREIMIKVIEADPTYKDIKLDGKSDDYVTALFDAAAKNLDARKDNVSRQTQAAAGATHNDSDRLDAEAERQKTIARFRTNGGKKEE